MSVVTVPEAEAGGGWTPVARSATCSRSSLVTSSLSILRDEVADGQLRCDWMLATRDVALQLPHAGSSTGSQWGLTAGADDRLLWVPGRTFQDRGHDRWGRRLLQPQWLSVGAEGRIEAPAGLCVTIVSLHDPLGALEQELRGAVERPAAPYVVSDWFRAFAVADLWDVLVAGRIYDPRPSPVDGFRFPCGQCAWTWWRFLRYLDRGRGSHVAALLARLVGWTAEVDGPALADAAHGLHRADPPESHARFVWDGVSLLGNLHPARGVEAAVRAVARFGRPLGDAVWFEHDSLELAGGPTRHRAPRLGQSPGSTVCLNTHVQALTTLARLGAPASPPGSPLGAAYEGGRRSLRRMLQLRAGGGAYRVVDAMARPVIESRSRRHWRARVLYALGHRLLAPAYWGVRRRWPRFVHPNGFIERDMASAMLADDYHVLNLKDLLLLYRLDPAPWLERPLHDGVRLLRRFAPGLGVVRSPLFAEAADVAWLYGQLFEVDTDAWRQEVEAASRAVRGGTPLDVAVWRQVGLADGFA